MREVGAVNHVEGKAGVTLLPSPEPLPGSKSGAEPAKDVSEPVSAGNIARMKAIYAQMKDRSRGDLEDAVELGRLLIAAKKAIGHGNWTAWLQKNVACSEVHARACMRIAKASDLGLIKDGMTFLDVLEAVRAHKGKKGGKKKGKDKPVPPKPQRLDLEKTQAFLTQLMPKGTEADVIDVHADERAALEKLAVAAIRKAKVVAGKGLVVLTLRLAAR